MNNFTVAVQKPTKLQQSVGDTDSIAGCSIATSKWRRFPWSTSCPIKENMKTMITRSGKTMAEPKAKPKKTSPTNPVEEEEKAKAEVEAELRLEKEEENLGKASLRDISDTHLLPFPRQAKKHVEDEKFSRFMEVIRIMYIHIPMMDAMQVPTYARYLKDILNQK
jgi:hypothetical protein